MRAWSSKAFHSGVAEARGPRERGLEVEVEDEVDVEEVEGFVKGLD